MSKRPAKRKASSKAKYTDDDDDFGVDSSSSLLASLDLSDSKTSPKFIANALLSLLPDGATKQNANAKKLLKAFPLVVAELDVRAAVQSRASESTGTRMPISFRFQDETEEKGGEATVINMPEECFVNMMKFLNGREINKASTVNKAWLSVCRQPALWECLDSTNGLTNSDGKKLNMTSFLKLLGRPQFSNLKTLSIPYKLKFGKTSCKQISLACPYLESLDISGMKAKDHDLVEVAERFTNLTSINIDMWNVTNYGIRSMAQAMGEQLLHLKIRGDSITEHYLSDSALGVVASSCQNLISFSYIVSSFYYKKELDGLSGAGILSLVEGCRNLEILELCGASNVGKDTFRTIANNVAQGEAASIGGKGRYALREIKLRLYPFTISGYPFRIEDCP